MNEKFEENYETIEETAPGNSGILYPGVSSRLDSVDSTFPGGTGNITVSGGDLETDVVPGFYFVDGIDSILYYSANGEATEVELVEDAAETEVLYSADTLAVLERIDYKLSIIVFLLLFYWCAHKIKNSVRGFTGRGLDN